MSLAEELLADLEDSDEEDITQEADHGDKVGEEEQEVAMEVAGHPGREDGDSSESVRDVAKLYYSPELQSVISRMESFNSGQKRSAADVKGPVEADPEYQLIVEANNLAAEIDNEVGKFYLDKLHKPSRN